MITGSRVVCPRQAESKSRNDGELGADRPDLVGRKPRGEGSAKKNDDDEEEGFRDQVPCDAKVLFDFFGSTCAPEPGTRSLAKWSKEPFGFNEYRGPPRNALRPSGRWTAGKAVRGTVPKESASAPERGTRSLARQRG